MKNKQDTTIVHIPELSDFRTIYSATGGLILVDLIMKDSLEGCISHPQTFPELQLGMRTDIARELAVDLLRCVEEVEAGRHHP